MCTRENDVESRSTAAKPFGMLNQELERGGKKFSDRSIGLAFPYTQNVFLTDLLNAVSIASQCYGYMILISFYEDDTPGHEEECVAKLLEHQVDGILLFPTSKDDIS